VCFLLSVTNGFNQKVYQIIRVTHNTSDYYFFDKASSNFIFGLLQKEKNLATKTNLSRNSLLVDSSFKKFQIDFFKAVPIDFFNGTVKTVNKTITDTLDKTIWTETTLYSFDLKTKKIVSYLQVKILFDGMSAEDEMKNPRILNIQVFTPPKIIDRKKFINEQKHFLN
jgi:hypothetical protein